MYLAILIIGVFLCFYTIWNNLAKRGFAAIATDPISLFSLYFGLIHFITPILKYRSERYRFQNNYDELNLIYTAFLTLAIYIFALYANKYFRERWIRKLRRPVRHITHTSKFKYNAHTSKGMYIGVFLFLIGAHFAWSDLGVISVVIGGSDNFLADRHLATESRNASRILVNLMIVGSVLYLASMLGSIQTKYRLLRGLGLASMLAFAIYYFGLIQSRNGILLILLFNGTVFCFYRPIAFKISGKSVAAGLGILMLAAAGISYAYNVTVARYSISESAYAQERLNDVTFYMLDGAFGNDENMIWMTENDFTLFKGSSYIAAFTNIIPRRFWKEKPLGGGPKLINLIRPGSYQIGGLRNNSITTGLLAEARMNFGILGLFLVVTIWAWIANFAIYRAIKSTRILTQVQFLLFSISLSTMLLYSEFLGYMVRLYLFVIPLMLISFILQRSKRGRFV